MPKFCLCWLLAEKKEMCQSEIQEAIGIESRAAPAADDINSTIDNDGSDDNFFVFAKRNENNQRDRVRFTGVPAVVR